MTVFFKPDLLILDSNHNLLIRASTIALLGKIGAQAKIAIPTLLKFLKDNDKYIQILAADAIAQINPSLIDSVPILVDALQINDETLRYNVVVALTKIGEKAVPALMQAYTNSNISVRKRAIQAIALIRPKTQTALPVLIQALDDNDSAVRVSAVQALRSMGKMARPAVPALLKALEDQEEGRVRENVILALKIVGATAQPTTISALKQVLKYGDYSSQIAIEILVTFGKPAIPALINALQSEHFVVRQGATEALGDIGKTARVAIPALTKALDDEHPDVRYGAVNALRKMGATAQPTISTLIKVLQDDDYTTLEIGFETSVRQSVIETLVTFGKPAIPALINALQNKNIMIRRGVTEILKEMGTTAQPAIPALILVLKDEDDVVRQNAVEALRAMGERVQSEIPALIQALQDERIHSSVVSILSSIGTSGVPTLINALESDHILIRRGAIEALAGINFKQKRAVSTLTLIKTLKEYPFRNSITPILEKKGLLTIPTLLKVLTPEEKKLSLPILKEALRGIDEEIRYSAAYTLGQLGSKAQDAENTLISIVNQEEGNLKTRWMAAMALKQIRQNIDLQDFFSYYHHILPSKVNCPANFSFSIYNAICLKNPPPLPLPPPPPEPRPPSAPAFGVEQPIPFGGGELQPQDLFTWFREKFGTGK